MAEFVDHENRSDNGLLLYRGYVSRPQEQNVEVDEEINAPKLQTLNVKHRETFGASGY